MNGHPVRVTLHEAWELIDGAWVQIDTAVAGVNAAVMSKQAVHCPLRSAAAAAPRRVSGLGGPRHDAHLPPLMRALPPHGRLGEETKGRKDFPLGLLVCIGCTGRCADCRDPRPQPVRARPILGGGGPAPGAVTAFGRFLRHNASRRRYRMNGSEILKRRHASDGGGQAGTEP
jgi:hypothetical protein